MIGPNQSRLFSGPSPSSMPDPSVAHTTMYEPSWRSYPPSFASQSAPPPPPPRRPSLPSPAYADFPNRVLPDLPHHDVPPPYARTNSFSSATQPSPPPRTPRPNTYPLMNGSQHEPPRPPSTPHSVPPDYRSRMLYPPQQHVNGEVPHQPPPPPPPPPPHSIPPSQYAHPVSHLPQTTSPYDPAYYSNQPFGLRQRKATRAQQACDQCRARKAKCDEGRPSCSHCKENNLACVYKEVPPHKQEKATQALLDRINELARKLQSVEDAVMSELSTMQKFQSQQEASMNQSMNQMRQEITELKKRLPRNGQPTPQDSRTPSGMERTLSQKPLAEPQGSSQDDTGSNTDPTVTNNTNNDEDGELSIPVDHSTAAHKLLRWPSIRNLLQPKEYHEDYVMRLEDDRGLIRIYGQGEGDDTASDPETPTIPSTVRSSPSLEETSLVRNHLSPPYGKPGESLAGITESGRMITNPETVRRYHQSYIEHMQKLHPFLDQNEISAKLETFISLYCPSQPGTPAKPLLDPNTGQLPRGAKRKRSNEVLYDVKPELHACPAQVKNSIDNAIILLVIALGAICEWRELPIPGPIGMFPQDLQKERLAGVVAVPSTAPSPDAVSRSFSFPAAGDKHNVSSCTPPESGPRNLDVIPGLAYYAYATKILGTLQGGNRLPNVQAALLAGLYAGQLAHPFQSHAWIFQAARACQVLMRPNSYARMQNNPRKDLYEFAYWTCLQLESDLLAELDLPASGISRSEGRISLPSGPFTLSVPNEIHAPNTMMMILYFAQIHLRKVLNRVHTDLYKVEKQGHANWSTSVQSVLSMNLDLWRSNLPTVMKWNDSDPPASDINVARLRAKYYGARYIIHRPLLNHALHLPVKPEQWQSFSDSPNRSASPSLAQSQRTPGQAGSLAVDHCPVWPGPKYRELPRQLRRACKICVDSAIASTIAFDGVRGRPIVTNIFGTAHAQFGNILVLAATYTSGLSELVDRDLLEHLFKRTINFLLQSRYISPSLRADARILQEIYQRIFGKHVVLSDDVGVRSGNGSATASGSVNYLGFPSES